MTAPDQRGGEDDTDRDGIMLGPQVRYPEDTARRASHDDAAEKPAQEKPQEHKLAGLPLGDDSHAARVRGGHGAS
jgi:hypothetical protein